MSGESSSSDESQEAAKPSDRPLSEERSSSAELVDYKTTEFSTTNLSDRRRIDKQVTANGTVDQSTGGEAKAKSPGQPKANCGHCQKVIYDEQPMKFDLKSYHRFCFKCSSCGAQLDNASNAAYLCEVEKRFYCIRCCDCKCWLTNAGKAPGKQPDKETVDKADKDDKAGQINKADHLRTGSNESKLIFNKRTVGTPPITPPSPPATVLQAPVNGKHSDTTVKKKCKFCNQILPDYLQGSQPTDLNAPAAAIDQRRAAQTDTKLNHKTQTNKPKTNLDSKQLVEQAGSWNAGKLNHESNLVRAARRSPNRAPGGQEESRIRLVVKKPVIGARIARIIDKLENSLNLKSERKFQESFYRNVEQSLEQLEPQRLGRADNLPAMTEPSERNVANTVNQLGSQLSRRPNEQRKFDERTSNLADQQLGRNLQAGLEQKLEQKLERKLEQKNNLHPDRRPAKPFATTKHNEPNVQRGSPNFKANQREPVYCPNCKMVLPTSLLLKRSGTCRPFCTVHCPYGTQADAKRTDRTVSPTVNSQRAFANPVNLERLNGNTRKPLSDLRAVDELRNYNRPYNLLLPDRARTERLLAEPLPADRLPGANRLESEKRPTREPTEDANRAADHRSARTATRTDYADDQATAGICCKCGLKVCLNEPPAGYLKCSVCGCLLSPGRHSVSPNGEALCNFACSNRPPCADSYAFNVKHTLDR